LARYSLPMAIPNADAVIVSHFVELTSTA
jgi:hypothetical protein